MIMIIIFSCFLSIAGPWVPIVDDFASEPFLPAHPETLLKQDKVSKVPIMLGPDDGTGFFWNLQTSTFSFFHTIPLLVNQSEDLAYSSVSWNKCV